MEHKFSLDLGHFGVPLSIQTIIFFLKATVAILSHYWISMNVR